MLRLERRDRGGIVERLLGIERLELRSRPRAAELLLELHGTAQAALAERDQVTGALRAERFVADVVGTQPVGLPTPGDLAGRHRLALRRRAARPVLACQVRGPAGREDRRVDRRAELSFRVDGGALRSPPRDEASGLPLDLLAPARRLALP